MAAINTFSLFFLCALAVVLSRASSEVADPNSCQLLNSAFVFIKPHANTVATQDLVRNRLVQEGCTIVSENEISSSTINKRKLIDQHYYSIASKATLQSAQDIPVPAEKFQAFFGESWEKVLAENRACNALQASQRFGCTPDELNQAWQDASAKVIKLGGGFYCGHVTWKDTSLYVFNAFFLQMRSQFVQPGTSIYYFEVEWNPIKMSWKNFRRKLLGSTDPTEAPRNSLRRIILDDYESLGLAAKPNKGNNGVHASASPFEGLAERLNWLGRKDPSDDEFGRAVLATGIPKKRIVEWTLDPRVTQEDGSSTSIFDSLEDLDADECIHRLKTLHELNLAN